VGATEQRDPGGRILALDVGKRRIGLAVSDQFRITAQGLETLERTRIRDDLEKLRETIEKWQIGLLLVGRPLHMNGSESRQSRYTEEFAARLGEYVQRSVVYWDERLTSAEAERMLKQASQTLEQRKRAVDKLAAILLLESYLGYLEITDEASARGSLG